MTHDFLSDIDKVMLRIKYPPSPFRERLISEEIRDLVDIYRFALGLVRDLPDGDQRNDAVALLIHVSGALVQKSQYGYLDAVNEFIIPLFGWDKVEAILLAKIKLIEAAVDKIIKTPGSSEEKENEIKCMHHVIGCYSLYIFNSDTYNIINLANEILPTMETFSNFLSIKDGDGWKIDDFGFESDESDD